MSCIESKSEHQAEPYPGLDRGAADLIASGDIKVKQGVQPSGFSKDSLVFADGSSLRADVVILAYVETLMILPL